MSPEPVRAAAPRSEERCTISGCRRRNTGGDRR
ncbi:hypothetical protein Ae150APs1_2216c [Pseudonocardia sp. Ae150A_Ps1]|nr:hypothetical protein Ae150APs1_2216c [Pseudonocardia sp. Ae150A_Ps1]